MAPDQFPGGLLPLFWTPLTYGFLHGGWEHVIGNVAWLVIFGTPVARRYGATRTLVIFFISSIIGALAFAITAYASVAYLVGASGGIAGLTGAAMRFIFQPVIVGRDPLDRRAGGTWPQDGDPSRALALAAGAGISP